MRGYVSGTSMIPKNTDEGYAALIYVWKCKDYYLN